MVLGLGDHLDLGRYLANEALAENVAVDIYVGDIRLNHYIIIDGLLHYIWSISTHESKHYVKTADFIIGVWGSSRHYSLGPYPYDGSDGTLITTVTQAEVQRMRYEYDNPPEE